MIDTGFIAAKDGKPITEAIQKAVGENDERPRGRPCPRCGAYGMVKQEGCETCTSCGYSKCS